MGDRQSVVVLKKDDWCLHNEERVCRIVETGLNIIGVYWTDVNKHGFADPRKLTLIPKELYPILSDSI
jgi:hypothetical protein